MTTEANHASMTKARLLKEIETLPDDLVVEALDFVAFIQARREQAVGDQSTMKPEQRQSTARSMLEFAGVWGGNDLEECLEEARALRG